MVLAEGKHERESRKWYQEQTYFHDVQERMQDLQKSQLETQPQG